MLTENGMDMDQNAFDQVMSQADVLTIGFMHLPWRLLIDTRFNDETGPMIRVVEPVSSVQERYLWLGRHRGMFGAPQGFSFFGWPHTIRGLWERDALRVMRDRLAAAPGDGVEQLDAALHKLSELENEEYRRLIRGEAHWKTLWEAQPA